MELSAIPYKVNCCICDGVLDLPLCMIDLPIPAKWAYPVHGNILADTSGLAMAFACHSCTDKFQADRGYTLVKYAVEFKEGQVIYHPIQWIDNVGHL